MYDKSMRYALMVDWGDSKEPSVVVNEGFIYLTGAVYAAKQCYPNFVKSGMVWIVDNKGFVYDANGKLVGEV